MKKTKNESVIVTFRLLETEFQRLKVDGAKVDQSPGERARKLLRYALDDSGRKDLEHRLERLEAKLELLIEMLEASTQVLLTHAGKLSVEDAESWVTKSFR